MSVSSTTKLTKKQAKGVAFRSGSRKKGKDRTVTTTLDDELGIPEEDDDDEEVSPHQRTTLKPTKKRKLEDEEVPKEGEEEEEYVEGVAAKRRRRKKAAKAKAETEGEIEDGNGRSSKLILFVGNLPYDISVQQVEEVFTTACKETPQVRLLTSKQPNPSKNSERSSKGFAFVQFQTSAALQLALRLHHTPISTSSSKTRKMNVELSAGGGGSTSTIRKQKIEQARARLEKQRDKRLTKSIKEVAEQKARGDINVVDDTVVKHGQETSKKSESVTGKKVGKPSLSGANAIRIG